MAKTNKIKIMEEHKHLKGEQLNDEERKLQEEIEKLMEKKKSLAKIRNNEIKDKQALAAVGAYIQKYNKTEYDKIINSDQFDIFTKGTNIRKLFDHLKEKDKKEIERQKIEALGSPTNDDVSDYVDEKKN